MAYDLPTPSKSVPQENVVVICKNRARIAALEEEIWRLEAADRPNGANTETFDVLLHSAIHC